MGRPELLNIFFDQEMPMPEKLKRLFFSSSEAGPKAAEYLSRLGARTEDHDTAPSGQVAVNQLKAMALWENSRAAFSHLYRISQPVLVLNGNNDIMIPTANSFTLNAHLPNATLAIYPDSGHGSLYQHPATFVAHIEEFLVRN
jgi:pimeloyl-ACP methyl ester carboxylesterase